MRFRAPAVFLYCAAAAAQAPSGTGMNLREAVDYALLQSPELKAGQAEVDRRQGQVAAARSLLMPQVDLAANGSRSRFERGYPAGGTPSLLRFDDALYTASVDLKLLAWDFHKTSLELAAARERMAAARTSVDRRRQEVVFETARLFLQTLAYTDLMAAAESRIQSLNSLLGRTNRLVRGGRAVPVDALKIKTRLAQVESDLATLRSGREASLSALAAVMGYEGELPRLKYAAPSFERARAAVPEGELLREAGANRPELRAQNHEIAAAERVEEAARKSAWPRIDLYASAMQYGSNTPVGFPQLISRLLPALPVDLNAASPGNAAVDWALGVHVSVPLFDGGRRRGEAESARAHLEQARLARRQLQLRVAREVRTAAAELEGARSRVEALRNSVVESERVLRDERLKFEAGRSVIDFVLDAESALLTNQSLLSQAERSVSIAQLTLDLGLGRIGPFPD